MKDRFGSLTIFLHWFMLALLAAVYACIELRVLWPKGSDPRDLIKTWHFMLGLSVFALVWIRLLARVRGGTPPIVPKPAAWQTGIGHAMHAALYLLMICMPVAGWLILSAAGKPIPFFGLELPPLGRRGHEAVEHLQRDVARMQRGLQAGAVAARSRIVNVAGHASRQQRGDHVAVRLVALGQRVPGIAPDAATATPSPC